jgi:pilus assembly protein Flp/PilA
MQTLWQFLEAEDGPTAVEYAVMLALIVAACLVAIETVGSNTAASFQGAQEKINNAIGGS